MLYFDCSVNESDVFFKEGDNYFRLIIGTDGVTTPHMHALRANALCIRNVGWYRTLFPLNATGGYHLTDSPNNSQRYSTKKCAR